MIDLSFVTDQPLQAMLERDTRELADCLKHHLSKSTLLLSGSIIEAMLVDFFLAFTPTEVTIKQVQQADLNELIDWAAQANLISERTRELATVVRQYRNLIHPGRERRLAERIDVPTATVAANLVEIIAAEIATNYANRRGYTAEQAIRKVLLDPSCAGIFDHLLDRMHPGEHVRLFRLIPHECATRADIGEADIKNFVRLHSLLKRRIIEEVLRSEVGKLYDYIANGSQREVVFYLRFFVGDLGLLTKEQRTAVLRYLLNILEEADDATLREYETWDAFDGFGEYFRQHGATLVETIHKRSLRWYHESDLGGEAFLRLMATIFFGIDYDECEHLLDEGRGAKYVSKLAKRWITYIHDHQIPF